MHHFFTDCGEFAENPIRLLGEFCESRDLQRIQHTKNWTNEAHTIDRVVDAESQTHHVQ